MKKGRIFFTTLVFCSVICGMGFLAVNIYENARVKPSTISHEGGGGSSIRDYYFSFDTPNFKAMGEKIVNFATNAGEVISNTATELGNHAEKEVKEFVSERYEEESSVSEELKEEE